MPLARSLRSMLRPNRPPDVPVRAPLWGSDVSRLLPLLEVNIPMKPSFCIFAPLLLALPLAAQMDTIHLVNGDKITKVKVQDYDYSKITYKSGRISETKERELIARIDFGQKTVRKLFNIARKQTESEEWNDAFVSWVDAADKAEKSKTLKPFAQVALYNAFEIAKRVGEQGDRMKLLKRLESCNGGKTAYWPQIWGYRLSVARDSAGNDRAKLENYKAMAKNYANFVGEKGLGNRYKLEADLYMIDARTRLVELKPADAKTALERMLPQVEASYPDLAGRINLSIALSVLAGNDFEGASKLFTEIVANRAADSSTKAQALVGRGHTWLRRSGRTPEQARAALLDYMRVAILYEDAGDEVVGEALYHAVLAYDGWNGVDKDVAKRRLRTSLKLNYSSSSWASK